MDQAHALTGPGAPPAAGVCPAQYPRFLRIASALVLEAALFICLPSIHMFFLSYLAACVSAMGKHGTSNGSRRKAYHPSKSEIHQAVDADNKRYVEPTKPTKATAKTTKARSGIALTDDAIPEWFHDTSDPVCNLLFHENRVCFFSTLGRLAKGIDRADLLEGLNGNPTKKARDLAVKLYALARSDEG